MAARPRKIAAVIVKGKGDWWKYNDHMPLSRSNVRTVREVAERGSLGGAGGYALASPVQHCGKVRGSVVVGRDTAQSLTKKGVSRQRDALALVLSLVHARGGLEKRPASARFHNVKSK